MDFLFIQPLRAEDVVHHVLTSDSTNTEASNSNNRNSSNENSDSRPPIESGAVIDGGAEDASSADEDGQGAFADLLAAHGNRMGGAPAQDGNDHQQQRESEAEAAAERARYAEQMRRGAEQQQFMFEQRAFFQKFANDMASKINITVPRKEKECDTEKVSLPKGDLFAQTMMKTGLNSFNLNAFAVGVVKELHCGIAGNIVNKVMSMDASVKRGEALTKAKFNPNFMGFPRLVMDGLVNRRVRKDMLSGRLTADEALVKVLMVNSALNALCIEYPLYIQLECAQRFGGRIWCEKYTGKLLADLETSKNEACFNKAKTRGFDAITFGNASFGNKKRKRDWKSGKGPASKRKRVDFSVYMDKTSAKFVPKGFCIWKFGIGKCNKSDAECSHKHTRWTDAEMAAARAS